MSRLDLNILMLCPGGQTKGQSPSELLAQAVATETGWKIDVHNFEHDGKLPPRDYSNYQLVWGEMDGANVPTIALELARQWGARCYIHGEWVPPYRFEKGWDQYFNEPTDLSRRKQYERNLRAMQGADLVSLALSATPGGFDFVKAKTGITFQNSFVRYPNCPLHDWYEQERSYQVATIARVNDGKKRVQHTVAALKRIKPKPTFKVIGGAITDPDLTIEALGAWNRTEKVQIYAESLVAVQHWSGIPPAEAIQQLCPVVSYDIPYMRELYGEALHWVPKDDVNALAQRIEMLLKHPEEAIEQTQAVRNDFRNGRLNVLPTHILAKQLAERFQLLF